MSDLVEDGRPRSSRRSVLKKGVVAGGIAWTAPIITTLTTPVAAAVGSAGGSYTYCFDVGLEGWTINNAAGAGNGLWHLSTDRSVSGATSLHYGSDAPGDDYKTGGRNAGTVTSPAFTVPGAAPQDLEFEIFRRVEVYGSGRWDEFSVSILGGATLYSRSRDGGTPGAGFEQVSISLAGFANQTIQLVFAFDTGDGSFNNFEGIYVDNILVPGATPPGGGAGSIDGGSAQRTVADLNWMPNRVEPTTIEQRRRERAARAASFKAGVVEDGDLQSGVKSNG
jgi:hypothetical protein